MNLIFFKVCFGNKIFYFTYLFFQISTKKNPLIYGGKQNFTSIKFYFQILAILVIMYMKELRIKYKFFSLRKRVILRLKFRIILKIKDHVLLQVQYI